jgi:polyisoprenoid-binding protein YceI
MLTRFVAAALLLAGLTVAAADRFAVEPAHTGVAFRVSHLGLSWTLGRFNDVSGDFTVDAADPAKSAFNLAIKVDSIDTGNKQRDAHLRAPDFFDDKQFPLITFKSTAVKKAADGFEVTGDMTMHGVTKSITLPLKGGRTAEFPKGTQRTGYTTELTLKRSDFGMKNMTEFVGDDVYVVVSFEGVKK